MNLRQVRKKIKSVSNVKKITKAMQLVSAVKMKKAQTVAIEGRPYQIKLEELFYRVLPSIDVSMSPLLNIVHKDSARELTILISSNKGLCGAFNMNLFRAILKNMNIKNSDFITLGKKGTIFASLMGGKILADFSSTTSSSDVAAVFELLLKSYLEGTYTKVSLAYNRFISTLRNEPTIEQLLPFEILTKNVENLDKHDYLVEPDKQKLFEQILINFLEEKIRSAIQNSEASEHSARMLAMKNATDNATDVIYSLTKTRNNLRQQKITYELLDMITAKESIEE